MVYKELQQKKQQEESVFREGSPHCLAGNAMETQVQSQACMEESTRKSWTG